MGQRKIEREVREEIDHANLAAQKRASVISPEAAAEDVIETAERIRKTSHQDSSVSWAGELEESVMDLEEEKLENEEKAKERRARHRHDHEVREELLHVRQATIANAHKAMSSDETAREVQDAAAVVRKTARGDGSGSRTNQLEESVMDLEREKHGIEEKAKERRANHALENQVREEVLHAQQQQPWFGMARTPAKLPAKKPIDASSNVDIVQSSANFVVFLLFAAILGAVVLWKKFVNSGSHSVHVPGLGKVSMVQSERMVMGLFSQVALNAGLDVYREETRARAPLKPSFVGPKQGYGVFTL